MKKLICCIAIFSCLTLSANTKIVPSEARESVAEKIENQPWAKKVAKRISDRIDPLVERHQTDPEWITSRMAMYWEDGKHFTQCYLKDQVWDRGEGNAPVPTVRMPGMRKWNRYDNVPLEQREPYNKSGDMLGVSRIDPSAPPVKVPYKESGHMIRGNNVEILTLAEEAAFLYWLNGDEKYARFAADIFNQWLAGTYFMNPILDPGESSKGKGGYEPGGILGYYDYEQIHDDLALHAATVYDFLGDYLEDHPSELVATTGKSVKEAAGEVFKRFVDIGFVRGGKSGNWNVNGWNMMLLPILVLEDDSDYADGKGRQHYLRFLTEESTQWHDAIPDILKSYDPITGLWPESPGYSFGTISLLLDFAQLIKTSGRDIIADNPIMQKAALAVLPWMDDRANMVLFGDYRGGKANFHTLEMLLSYYLEKGDKENADKIASALNNGIANGYDRSGGNWRTLVTYASEIPTAAVGAPQERMSYSPFHRVAVMKSRKEKENLMAVVYGGRDGSHLTPNGLAIQLYGFGYALAPDAAGYESYWSADQKYHQTATGANTIIPGYTHGDVTVRYMEPTVADTSFVNYNSLNPHINFIEMEAGEKRRSVAIVKTDSENGYYVDVFRSNLPDNDYIFHNVGKSVTLSDKDSKVLPLANRDSLPAHYLKGYDWFANPRSVTYDKDFKAVWDIASGDMAMNMWMAGAEGRELVVVDAPYTNLNEGVTPENVSIAPGITPTIIVRQNGNNAWDAPYVAVFQPSKGAPTIENVERINSNPEFTALRITGKDGRSDIVMVSENPGKRFKTKGLESDGAICIATQKNGKPLQLYALDATFVKFGKWILSSDRPFSASVYEEDGKIFYSSDAPVTARIDGKNVNLSNGCNKQVLAD